MLHQWGRGFGVAIVAVVVPGWLSCPADTEEPAEESDGLLPLPDYAGDLWTRSRLTGNWGGARTDLAERGIQLDVDWTQVAQSVVNGGRGRDTRYGGSLDYLLHLDLHRMGALPGAIVKVRGETRYGESVNDIAGSIMPASLDGLFPLASPLDDDIPLALTSLTYIQFLSEKFGVLLGKFDTIDGDLTEFASGRGNTQFLNANFIFSPVVALTVPYSTLGGGVIWMPDERVTIGSLVFTTADASTTSGFDDIGDGWTWSTEVQVQYGFGALPGGQTLGFVYSFDDEFSELGSGRFAFRRGEGLTFDAITDDETWAAYWNLWQYLWAEQPVGGPVDLANGEPDHQGMGVFLRAGFADQDVNPVEWSVSGGIGGRGMIPSRDDDTFGIGYAYTAIQTNRFFGLVGLDDRGHGLEAFYNIAVTPAARLTLDLQVLDSPVARTATGVVLGVRLVMSF